MEVVPAHLVRAALGLVLNAVIGIVARRWCFCTLSATDDAAYPRDLRRPLVWLPASGIAVLGTQLLESEPGLDLSW